MTDNINYRDFAVKLEVLMMLYNSKGSVRINYLVNNSSSDRNLLGVVSLLTSSGLVTKFDDGTKFKPSQTCFQLSDRGRKRIEEYIEGSYNLFSLFLQ